MDCDPKTLQEYIERASTGCRIVGVGMNVRVELCCPFCAEPDYVRYRIIEMRTVLAREHVCKTCGRGSITIFNEYGAATRLSVVQTCGEDPPSYLEGIARAA